MVDPLSLVVGALILAFGYLSGRIGRARRTPKTKDPYICGCTHHLSHHDPKTNACKASVYRPMADTYKPCACQQYVGERPVDLSLLAEQARAAQLHDSKGESPE